MAVTYVEDVMRQDPHEGPQRALRLSPLPPSPLTLPLPPLLFLPPPSRDTARYRCAVYRFAAWPGDDELRRRVRVGRDAVMEELDGAGE